MNQENICSGTVTAITDQRRDPERVNIALDGQFAFGLARLVAAQHGLHVGQVLSADEVAALRAADEVERAVQAGVQFLAYRPRSEREVRDRLNQRGFSPVAIDEAVARLKRWRYLDDEAFARFWVENRAEHRPQGHRRLKSELRAKGVDPALAAEVIEEAGGDEFPAALALAQKRVTSLRGLDPLVQRRRLAGFLQRRGYGWDVVRPVLDRVLGEAEEDDPPA